MSEVHFSEKIGVLRIGNTGYYLKREIFTKSVHGLFDDGLYIRGTVVNEGTATRSLFFLDEEALIRGLSADIESDDILEIAKLNEKALRYLCRSYVNTHPESGQDVVAGDGLTYKLYNMSGQFQPERY